MDTTIHRNAATCRNIHFNLHLQPFADHMTLDPTETRVMVRGQGIYLWDSSGMQYMDASSGAFCTAVGYGRPELVEAAAHQLTQLSYCTPFFNTVHPALAELTEQLFALLPDSFGRVTYTNSGSEANDVLIRVVRRYWDAMGKSSKKILVARSNGYHGSTVGSASLSGMATMHAMGDLPIPGVCHIDQPYWYGYRGTLDEDAFGLQLARELEEKILTHGPERVAAFVAEPIQGAAGIIIPPATYWPEIQRICRKYDVLLCLDEVTGGFGRFGKWFSCAHFGLEPDAITFAKGLTSGYVPMGGLAVSRKMADAVAGAGMFAHGLTFQGNPLAAAVACANLRLLGDGGLVERAGSDIGPYFQRRLRETFGAHPLVGEIQGVGLGAALQLAPPGKRKLGFGDETVIGKFCMQMGMEEGLIFRCSLARLAVAPPLIVTHAQVDELIRRLARAVDRTHAAIESA
ncbi:MAG TPA: aminotransferase [Noviherbaspirillum sp.]|jgi:adenosylmethionine-8-amino-7-oxononanoate aminotransferase|uniref:aminotransferase n=1 Tax=Noviherbaspirillum sp. TaxID=1926288 RepID=UPI002F934D15